MRLLYAEMENSSRIKFQTRFGAQSFKNLLLPELPIRAIIVVHKLILTMINLIQELTDGQVEYKDDGVVIRHAPTSTMLRAARALRQLLEQHETNMKTINDIVKQNQEILITLQQLRDDNDRLSSNIESLRNDAGRKDETTQISDVGSDGDQPSNSDSDSEGSGATGTN